MKLSDFFTQLFEMPGPFDPQTGVIPATPIEKGSDEHRNAADAVARPLYGFYNPDDLHFPQMQLPVVPTSGGYQTMGGGMIEYDHQPQWSRGDVSLVGPVNEMFRRWMYDRRIRHV